MSKSKTITKKQLAVIHDIFTGDTDVDTILKTHKVSRSTLNKWLADENFRAEFLRQIEWLNLQSQAFIAQCTTLAATRLVALTECEKEEVRRKACLDIISLPGCLIQQQTSEKAQDDDNYTDTISSQTAGRLLKILAEEQKNGKF